MRIDVRHDLQRAVGIWLLNGSDVTGLRLDGRNGSGEHSVGIRLLRVVEVTGVRFRFGTAVLACHVKKNQFR